MSPGIVADWLLRLLLRPRCRLAEDERERDRLDVRLAARARSAEAVATVLQVPEGAAVRCRRSGGLWRKGSRSGAGARDGQERRRRRRRRGGHLETDSRRLSATAAVRRWLGQEAAAHQDAGVDKECA